MPAAEPAEIVIEAGRTESQYWRDLYRYRELFYFLAWRDVIVRYKQTVIGVLWAVLRPLLTMIVFVFIFGKIAKLPTDGVPYPVMVFAAMLPWQLFATSLSEGSNSLISNANLISKVYFPRLIVPASAVIVSFVDFAISLGLLALLMTWYHVWPTFHLLALPLFTLLALIASTGAGLWLAALNVQYRDFRYVVPFIVQFGLYLSPVGFSTSIVPERWRLFYSLNPMVGVIDGFRWAVSGGHSLIYWPGVWLSIIVVSVLLAAGIWYFRRMERTFADVI
ncbi:MAG: phosphate ABC transporter permease [Chthoniobacterales bacterium]|nr:MAG: phosphate ABC transporter permease [Chthoniobacterales bacterium]